MELTRLLNEVDSGGYVMGSDEKTEVLERVEASPGSRRKVMAELGVPKSRPGGLFCIDPLQVSDRLSRRRGPALVYRVLPCADSLEAPKLRTQEMFVPLVHPPGNAQADFGEALVDIGGASVSSPGYQSCCPITCSTPDSAARVSLETIVIKL